MRLRHVIAVVLVLAAAGCDNRTGLGFDPNDGGIAGGKGGAPGGPGGMPGGTGGEIATCPGIKCPNTCQRRGVDSRGCSTCECVPVVCPDVACAPCPYGYKTFA